MAELALTEDEQELTPEELKALTKVNPILQQSWLMLVEHCYQPDYQMTLECCLQAQENSLKSRKFGLEFISAFRAPFITVLSACHDVSKEKTLANMRNSFVAFNERIPIEKE